MPPPCPDPEGVRRAVQMPPRWSELKKLIDELMEAKSVWLGFQTAMASSPDGRRYFRFDGLVYDRVLSSGVRPEAMAFNYEYGCGSLVAFNYEDKPGSLEAIHPTPGHTRAGKAGVFESSYLEAVHRVRNAPARPPVLSNIKRGQSSAEFSKVHAELIKVYRLFAEVLPAIDPEFRARSSGVIADIKREIDGHWRYHRTVRSDVWSTPVGSLKQQPGLSATATFEMTADKLRRLRELTGAGNVDLPVVLFELGQPKNPGQATGVLADERSFPLLVKKLREIQHRSGGTGFVVYGYADGSGRAGLNVRLSENRAAWIVSRLKGSGVRIPLKPKGCGDRNARAHTGNRQNPKQRAVLLVPE